MSACRKHVRFIALRAYFKPSGYLLCHLLLAERGDRVDKNVEREILNHRMLQNPNVVGFKEVGGAAGTAWHSSLLAQSTA
jgi:hypothetical protein